MSNEIDYEAEVRKAHPDASSSHIGNTRGYDRHYVWINEQLEPIGFSTKSYECAWKSAYDAIQHTLKADEGK